MRRPAAALGQRLAGGVLPPQALWPCGIDAARPHYPAPAVHAVVDSVEGWCGAGAIHASATGYHANMNKGWLLDRLHRCARACCPARAAGDAPLLGGALKRPPDCHRRWDGYCGRNARLGHCKVFVR